MDIDQAYLDAELAFAVLFANMVGPVDPTAYNIVHRPVVVSHEMRERILAVNSILIDDRPLNLYVETFFKFEELIDVEFVEIVDR